MLLAVILFFVFFLIRGNIRPEGCPFSSRLEQSDFIGQLIGGKMEIQLEKPALNNFKAYE